ncbi:MULTISPECIES: hypothetical protein [unclassified Wolbachia]|uniref:Uncharacterized protein n=1 Tax=Wolbachia pipientis TaxID=955 RepID=A0A6I6CEZ8_WOLPI|nr:hypothetical protein [Wolbachia endosymbiont of Ceratitis capitata]MBS9529145.1 hypothetical protein [Wolbachia endosymbiont of Ceratitis capitata]QGT16227.1 hypothetical protein E0495_02970 [Wolbachia pipientis]
MSSQCPDTGIQHFTQSHQERCILHNTFMLTNLIKFLDPSVSYSDDKKRSTGMTGEGGYSDDTILFPGSK